MIRLHHIRKARIAAGLTQSELAAHLNVDRSAVAQWETGKTAPLARRLRDIAGALGCTVDDLLDPEDHSA